MNTYLRKSVLTLFVLAGITTIALGNSAPANQAEQLAFTRVGYYLAFQYGIVYSRKYGQIISNYDEYNLLPTIGNFGGDTMDRISVGYNYNHHIAFEAALSDTSVSTNHRRSNYLDTGVTIQDYAFNIYNFELNAVFKNSFENVHTNIYTKLGLAYSYGALDINYNTTSGLGPSWNNLQPKFNNSYTATAIVPIYDFGVAWSANRYLALTFDYERSFKPIIGSGKFGDPKNSTIQVLNMFLFGAYYNF